MNKPVPSEAFIEMQGVEVSALRDSTLTVLQNVNWSVHAGEFWVIAGPQHSGKTDLLLHAAGLLTPPAGTCRLFGCNIGEFNETQIEKRLRMGFAFAEGKLFNQLTVAENISLPLRYHLNLPDAELVQTVETLLNLLDLAPYANLTPSNVPAVWRQRAALARALALKPDLLLLDNPNGGLTTRHRHWLVRFLDQLWRGHDFFGGRAMSIVVATDDLHVWQHAQRRFATVYDGVFSVVGAWGGEPFNQDHAIKELLAVATEASQD